jgi:hypothetical protein
MFPLKVVLVVLKAFRTVPEVVWEMNGSVVVQTKISETWV